MSCENTIFINGRPIYNVQSDLNSSVPNTFRETSKDSIDIPQFSTNLEGKPFDPLPACWSYYVNSNDSNDTKCPFIPCDEVTHFLDKKYNLGLPNPHENIFSKPVNQLDVFIPTNTLKSNIDKLLKTGISNPHNKIIPGTSDIVIYQIYFFIQLLHLSNTYYGVNKRLCSVKLPWTSKYDCNMECDDNEVFTKVKKHNSYKTIDYETMVALFQRCIVQRDPKLYLTHLFDVVNSLLNNALYSYIKKSRGLDSDFDSLGYKNFYKYMKNEIMANSVYKFKGIR